MSLTAEERETTVTITDADEVVRIWTSQRKHITKLRNHDSYKEIGTGYHEGTEWAEFSIPASDWNPATGAKRKRAPMSEEQRAVLAERLANARNSK